MAITDLPVLSMLRARMQWNQARQSLIAENVANADTPGFRPRDLAPLRADRAPGTAVSAAPVLAVTTPGHIASAGAQAGGQAGAQGGAGLDVRRAKGFEVVPSGNGVNLEDEMMKAGDAQTDYQLAASIYQHSLATLKIAVGKG